VTDVVSERVSEKAIRIEIDKIRDTFRDTQAQRPGLRQRRPGRPGAGRRRSHRAGRPRRGGGGGCAHRAEPRPSSPPRRSKSRHVPKVEAKVEAQQMMRSTHRRRPVADCLGAGQGSPRTHPPGRQVNHLQQARHTDPRCRTHGTGGTRFKPKVWPSLRRCSTGTSSRG
jgi:hypothetical protein